MNILAVGLGGFVGSVLRYLVGFIPLGSTQSQTGYNISLWASFPIKTFLINIVGAFVIGLVAAASAKNNSLNPQLVLFLKVGVCGGFTTFSTFSLETLDLLQKGQIPVALCYVVLSVVLGVVAVFAGQAVLR